MVVKGYYPSLSLGFEILFGFINTIAGIALTTFGIIIVLNRVAALLNFLYIGVAAITAGALAIFAGLLAIIGSCRESQGAVRTSYLLSVFALLAAGGVAGYAFMLSGGLQDTGRKEWYKMSDDSKQLIEDRYACCGWLDLNEKTEGCMPQQTCSDLLVADLSGLLKITVILAGATAGCQLFAIFCGCCLWQRMQNQATRASRKHPLTLMEEAHGASASDAPDKHKSASSPGLAKSMKNKAKREKAIEKEEKKYKKKAKSLH